MVRRKRKQGTLEFRSWGGARKGAGRKRVGARKCVPHRKRIALKSYQPQHTTMRLVDAVASVRRWRVFAEIVAAIHASHRDGFRVIEFSVQDGHLHLITEAGSARALGNGVRALSIRIARALNRVLGRRGKVFADRFHTRALASLREVRNAIVYVLQNARKHFQQKGVALRASWLDKFSSAGFFDGWSASGARESVSLRDAWRAAGVEPKRPTRDASTWLLQVGWRRLGRIQPSEVPAS